MLEQIIQDMYIDPELLEELDEEQKQVLFCKIREEQIRRYDVFEKEAEKAKEKKKSEKVKKGGVKMVDFLLGDDGNPWTWVMGEHESDKSVDLIMEGENLAKARQLAEQEAEELRKKQEEEFRVEQERLKREEEEKQAELQKLAEEAARQSQEEAKALERQLEEEKKAEQEKMDTLKLKRERRRKSSQIQAGEMKERRRSEIYQTFQDARSKLVAEAEASSNQMENTWVEQEKKVKELDNERRVIARRAREEHRRSLMDTLRVNSQMAGMLSVGLKNIRESNNNSASTEKPIVPPRRKHKKSRPTRPSGAQAVIEWMREVEVPRGAPFLPGTQNIAPWFHGIISRQDAENLLYESPPSSYLVRISEKVWGYAVSYRCSNKCKHFLVDASDRGYQFFGTNQIIHKSLTDLVQFHKTKPISLMGKEILMNAVGQGQGTPDYQAVLDVDSPAESVTTYL